MGKELNDEEVLEIYNELKEQDLKHEEYMPLKLFLYKFVERYSGSEYELKKVMRRLLDFSLRIINDNYYEDVNAIMSYYKSYWGFNYTVFLDEMEILFYLSKFYEEKSDCFFFTFRWLMHDCVDVDIKKCTRFTELCNIYKRIIRDSKIMENRELFVETFLSWCITTIIGIFYLSGEESCELERVLTYFYNNYDEIENYATINFNIKKIYDFDTYIYYAEQIIAASKNLDSDIGVK